MTSYGYHCSFHWTGQSKPLLKIRRVNKAGCFDIEASSLLAYLIFFLGICFLFFKIESWNFQHLFDLDFRETSKKFLLIRKTFIPLRKRFVWMSSTFVRFRETLSILTTKKVLFQKNMKCSTKDRFSLNREMPYCLATLLVYMALSSPRAWRVT